CLEPRGWFTRRRGGRGGSGFFSPRSPRSPRDHSESESLRTSTARIYVYVAAPRLLSRTRPQSLPPRILRVQEREGIRHHARGRRYGAGQWRQEADAYDGLGLRLSALRVDDEGRQLGGLRPGPVIGERRG